ncbi:hypothetical protein P8452_06028 [Trifolium repens]|nr:hypothetical protein P8452_06028 [Trifolium repens]
MENGSPLLHCLLQHTLRTICSFPTSSKWVYAVFWRVVPRNFPPPRWEFGGTSLDRSKGNKRNWIIVWEDGFCDFNECEQRKSGYLLNEVFGADVFFKMSHEVYSYGEGLVGKVAAENGHKWIYSDTQNGCESNYVSPWNASIDHQPRAWEFQLNSGIQTIAVIAVREGLVQLGSFNKIAEDLDLVLNIQRKFSYLQTIPGVFSIQRQPHLSFQNPYITKPNFQIMESNEISKNQVTKVNNLHDQRSNYLSMISINLGSNFPQNGTSMPPLWSPQPSLPNNHIQLQETNRIINNTSKKVKIEEGTFHIADYGPNS